jgi:HK97 family phage portal protein
MVMPHRLDPPWVYYPAPASTVDAVAALATPNVWACVRVLTDAASSCPLIAYRRGDSGRQRVSGRTADLLERPSDTATQANLIGTIVEHLNLWGNAYVGKYRDPAGAVSALVAIPPTFVQVELRNGVVIFTVTAATTGVMTEHDRSDIIHIKALSNDGLVGLAPITQMRQALDADTAVRTASTSLFLNNARPSGIIAAQHISADQAATIKSQWQGGHLGELSGGIAVLSGDLTFTPLAMPADDAEFCEARRLSSLEIARCFRIPPWMIGAGDTNSHTYSNVESQAQAFVTFSLMPWLKVIEQSLSADTDLFSGNTYCEFLLDGLLRGDSATRAAIYTQALNPVTGWMSRDEVRRLENLDPEPVSTTVDTASMNGQGVIA